jgi:hypothetical protein
MLVCLVRPNFFFPSIRTSVQSPPARHHTQTCLQPWASLTPYACLYAFSPPPRDSNVGSLETNRKNLKLEQKSLMATVAPRSLASTSWRAAGALELAQSASPTIWHHNRRAGRTRDSGMLVTRAI